MKWIIAAISILVSLAACSRSGLNVEQNPKLGEKFKIKYGQTVPISDSNITVQFTQVLSDSRCPKGVECFWAGNAKILIQFNNKPVKLNTNNEIGNENEVVISGYKIRLISLSPYPEVNNRIKKKNYVATLLIAKTGK